MKKKNRYFTILFRTKRFEPGKGNVKKKKQNFSKTSLCLFGCCKLFSNHAHLYDGTKIIRSGRVPQRNAAGSFLTRSRQYRPHDSRCTTTEVRWSAHRHNNTTYPTPLRPFRMSAARFGGPVCPIELRSSATKSRIMYGTKRRESSKIDSWPRRQTDAMFAVRVRIERAI